ncbi:MAG: hypothetical protein ACRBFS_18185 [Aureispira sp.]
MSATSHPNIPLWIQHRIVGFFNHARNVNMILEGPIQDDPSDGPGTTIGAILAARILRERNNLPTRRFTDLAQIDAVQGVGVGTIKDLVYSFGNSADDVFQQAMYTSGTIYPENWPLEYFRYAIEDKTAFEAIANDPENLRTFLVDKLNIEGHNRQVNTNDLQQMTQELREAYLDAYNNSTPAAAYALALWFYQFDADNWFSWEQIQAQTIAYFEHNRNSYPWRMDFYRCKGFVNRGLLAPGISAKDLPVTVNWAEQTISFWVSALYD